LLSINIVVNQRDHENCRIQRLVVSLRKLKQNQKVMMLMQYRSCVVKAHKVQAVKLTLYKYKS